MSLCMEEHSCETSSNSLFKSDCVVSADDDTKELPKAVVEGQVKILFAHPEALLSTGGRKLLNSEVYQQNVVACVIDEAHCVEIW